MVVIILPYLRIRINTEIIEIHFLCYNKEKKTRRWLMIKRIISLTIVGILLFSALTMGFADTQSNVDTLKRLGLVAGVSLPSGKVDYKLDMTLTRAEAAVILYKLSGGNLINIDVKKTPETFKDVKRKHWAFKYIAYCTDKGILTGMPGGVYKPDSPLSEKAFLAMLLKLQGYSSNDFTWDTVYVTAYEAGLVEDVLYTVNPEDNLTFMRGQAFDTLYRSLQQKHKGTGLSMIGSMVGKGILSYETALGSGLIKKDQQSTVISNIDVSGNTLVVNFNEDIKEPLTQNVSVLSAGIAQTIKGSQLVGGRKLIISIDNLIPKAKYSVQVSNVEDLDGNVASKLSSEVTVPSVDVLTAEGTFRLGAVKVIGPKMIVVEFNRNISNKSLQELIYTIERPGAPSIEGSFKTISTSTTPMKNAVLITFKTDTLSQDQRYTLKVKGDLTSAFGEYLNEGNGDSIAFDTMSYNRFEPVVEKAYAIDSRYMTVVMNYKLADDVGLQGNNYQLLDTNTNRYLGVSEVKYIKDESGKAVYYMRTDGIEAGRTYTLTIKNVRGQYGEDYRKDASYSIKPEKVTLDALTIAEMKVLDAQTIKVRFNRGIWQSNVPSVFIEKLAIYRVINDPNDSTSLLIYLYSPMNKGQVYTARFNGLPMDSYGVTYSIKNYDFVGDTTPVQKMAIAKTTVTADNRIVVTFNRELDIERPFIGSRVELIYTYNGVTSKILCDNVEYINSKVAVLKFASPIITNQGNYDLKITGITDLYNNSNEVNYRIQ